MFRRLPKPLFVLLTLPILSWLPSPPPESPATAHACALSEAGANPDSAATCAKCHTEIHGEWKDRAHAKAWTDPVFQASLKERSRPEACYACHIPAAVLDRLGSKPATRDDLKDEGVTCIACHKKDGAMHGPFGAKTDAHPSEKNPAFAASSNALCASCHSTKIGPVLPLGKDFEEAKLAEHNKSCVGCHMTEVERHHAVSMVTGQPVGEKRKGRKHDILGPDDAEFCARAFKLSAKEDGKDHVLVIGNEAGHRVPGLTLRKFVFVVRSLDGDGKALGEQKVEISSENELKVQEKREFRFAAKAGTDKLEVEIEHWFQGQKRATVKKLGVEIE